MLIPEIIILVFVIVLLVSAVAGLNIKTIIQSILSVCRDLFTWLKSKIDISGGNNDYDDLGAPSTGERSSIPQPPSLQTELKFMPGISDDVYNDIKNKIFERLALLETRDIAGVDEHLRDQIYNALANININALEESWVAIKTSVNAIEEGLKTTDLSENKIREIGLELDGLKQLQTEISTAINLLRPEPTEWDDSSDNEEEKQNVMFEEEYAAKVEYV